MNSKTYLLKKKEKESLNYIISLEVSDYKDLLFTLADVIKVAIVALDSEENSSKFIIDSRSNIKSLLEIALQLIPFQEAEILDEILLNQANKKT